MTELKAETIVPQGTTITLQMYPKAEADKVIAEKDATITELNQKLQDLCIHCPVKEQEDDVLAEKP